MADVKIHKAFPTTIYQFEYQPLVDDFANMEKHVSETRKNYKYHTDDDLHKQVHFIKLREKVYNVSKHYLNNLEYEYDKIEITGMWANKLYQGDAHPPHTHSNNILSGVYYLKSDKIPLLYNFLIQELKQLFCVLEINRIGIMLL